MASLQLNSSLPPVSSPLSPPKVRLALELLFEGVHGAGDLALVSSDQGATANDREGAPVAPQILRVGEAVTVSYDPASAPGRLTLEWQGGPGADAVADAVVAVVLGAGPAPPPRLSRLDAARAEALRGGDGEALARVEAELVEALLSAQFGPAATDPETVRGDVCGCCGGWCGGGG